MNYIIDFEKLKSIESSITTENNSYVLSLYILKKLLNLVLKNINDINKKQKLSPDIILAMNTLIIMGVLIEYNPKPKNNYIQLNS